MTNPLATPNYHKPAKRETYGPGSNPVSTPAPRHIREAMALEEAKLRFWANHPRSGV